MLLAGASALADMVDLDTPGAAILPSMAELPKITRTVARAVALESIEEGLNRIEVADVEQAIADAAWDPRY